MIYISKIIQVLGTTSDSGKTTVAMALCRYYSDLGFRVAPFKAVNMSLNSISIRNDGEISRAQWLQALAARTEPDVHMNPYILKPEGSGKSQLIELGKSKGSMPLNEYFNYLKMHAPDVIKKSLDYLLEHYDIIIAEGAGSPAEINMFGSDFANTFVSGIYNTPAILVADIDRGGVFASIYGTVKLMERPDLLKYIIINKMRGDTSILETGINKIEELTGKKIIGIVKYTNINLPGEDSMNYNNSKLYSRNVAIIKYPHMENYSDFDPLDLFGIGYNYVDKNNVDDILDAKIIILPGSKLVYSDLEYIKNHGIYEKIMEMSGKSRIIGICGGYQMLGNKIMDPHRIESEQTEYTGLNLLDAVTYYNEKKTARGVTYRLNSKLFGNTSFFNGYEIHFGSVYDQNDAPLNELCGGYEGSINKNVIGTNIHGIFENTEFLEYLFGLKFQNYNSILNNNIDTISRSIISGINEKYLKELIL